MSLPATALELAAHGMGQLSHVEVDPQTLQLRLDLFDEAIVLTRYTEGVPSCTYEVAAHDVAAAFAGTPVSTGLLPPECLFLSREQGQERLAIYVPPAVRTLLVQGDAQRALTVPLPGLVFVGQSSRYLIFATKERPGEHTPLFHAPFPNVNGDGAICTGTTPFPVCSTRTIHQAFRAFAESAFNQHQVQGKSRRHKENILLLWEALQDTEHYPEDDLRACPHTLSHLMGGST